MERSQQLKPNGEENVFYSAKSETLNPETKLNKFQLQQEDVKLLTLSITRAKKRIRQSATTKNRLSISGNSQILRSYESNRFSPKITFQPRETISTMVRDRHKIEQKTKKMTNFYNYLSVRLKQRSKRKQILKQKQIKMKETIDNSKQEKQFAQKAIKQHCQTVYIRKLNSRSSILHHRKSLKTIIDQNLTQKKTKGEQGRKQTMMNHSQIKRIKNNWLQQNKQAVQRGKSLQQIFHEQKLRRQIEKKTTARQNYKKKWMQQFMQKEKIQRQNRLKGRKLNKKIQYLLEENQKLESSFLI